MRMHYPTTLVGPTKAKENTQIQYRTCTHQAKSVLLRKFRTMIKALLIVGMGSFVGGALRYALSIYMKHFCGQGFPWGTLAVNLIGCFVFGIVFALFSKHGTTVHPWCLLLTTGLCGGFTTFSTFAHESIQMLQGGNIAPFAAYVTTSIVVGLAMVAIGYLIVR